MAFTVYPTGADSGFSEESLINSERDRLVYNFGGRMANFVVSPFGNGHFSLTTSGSSLDVDVAAGDAFVGGHLIRSDAAVTKTLNASVTSEIFLVVDDGKTNNAAIVAQDKSTTDPAGQYVVKLHEVTTDSSGVTGTTDFRPYIAFPEDDPDESITGQKTGTTGTIAIDTTGVKTVSVTFNQAYQTRIDSAVATLNSLTDTAANFGWIRTKNLSLTGFDVEAKVTKVGASGSTADFNYQTQGK